MAYPPITDLPTPPSRTDPANFASRGDAFLGALAQFQTQENALAAWMETEAAQAGANAAATAIQTVNLIPVTMSEEVYRARQADNREKFAGSGFVEWGKHVSGTGVELIGEGFHCYTLAADAIYMGRVNGALGVSRSDNPQLNINGSALNLYTGGAFNSINIDFPPAPTAAVESTTTTTANYSQGDFVVTGNDIYICIADSTSGALLTNTTYFSPRDKVSRQDIAFLEYWEELITTKDFVYPNGAVQFGATTWEGITLVNTFIAASYSAFGAWETSPVAGYGLRWSTASAANKQAFVDDPANNIFVNAAGQLVQGRFRIRTAVLFGDNGEINQVAEGIYNSRYFGFTGPNRYFKPQGQVLSLDNDLTLGSPIYANPTGTPFSSTDSRVGSIGGFLINNAATSGAATFSYGEAVAIPIALVQRRNQGAYHFVYNREGCLYFMNTAGDDPTYANFWYSPLSWQAATVADCFTYRTQNTTYTGKIGNPSYARPDAKAYDAIYASDVKDLRKSARRVESFARTNEREFQKLIAGEQRGFEGAATLRKYSLYCNSTSTEVSWHGTGTGVFSNANNFNPEYDNSVLSFGAPWGRYGVIRDHNGDFFRIAQLSEYFIKTYETGGLFIPTNNYDVYIYDQIESGSHKQETLLHCDIIGDPANYPADFTSFGAGGNSLVVAEDGTSLLPADVAVVDDGAAGERKDFKLSRKLTNSEGYPKLILRYRAGVYTVVPYAASTAGSHFFFASSNLLVLYGDWGTDIFDTDVFLVFYETPANGLEVASNSEVLDHGEVTAMSHSGGAYGSIFAQYLTGKIPVSGSNPAKRLGAIYNYLIDSSIGNDFEPSPAFAPTHQSGVLTNADSPSVKTLNYLTHENGVLYLQAIFKELIYDGVDYGDTGDFTVVDNISTATDDNADTVLVGQKRIELPFFYVEDEQ